MIVYLLYKTTTDQVLNGEDRIALVEAAATIDDENTCYCYR